jgi:uncharacterized protein (DUF1501 family)
MSNQHSNINPAARRAFLKRSAHLAALTGGTFAGTLASMGEVAAQTATDYKALVCVFLYGGNDQSNTIVPISNTEYAAYQSARPDIALAQSRLLPINPQNYTGPALGLAPEMTGLRDLFEAGKASIIANVGPLNRPTTISDYRNNRADLPTQLFSHSDQQGAWQTAVPDASSPTGWLGRIADATYGANTGAALSMTLSVSGNNTMQAGSRVIQYQLTPNGSVPIYSIDALQGSQSAGAAMRAQLTETRTHMFERQLTGINKRAIEADALVRTSLAAQPALATTFPANNRLASQLRMVARMIGARNAFSHKRQIFFVSIGGFDFHDNINVDQANRLKDVSDAMLAFNTALEELRVASDVTTFTASDFGRALQGNGRGSDHGWGSHHFVMGGAVQGKRVFGAWPTVALRGPEDVGQGRLLPTTAVDEYASTLATWFGVGTNDLGTVLPYASRFPNSNMAFMKRRLVG